MESQNCKVIREFITANEAREISQWIDSLDHSPCTKNFHMKVLTQELRGISHMFDISRSPLSSRIVKHQSGEDVMETDLPDSVLQLHLKIADAMKFPTSDCFVQAVRMVPPGKIAPHYDMGINGYINYKCNISVLSDDYDFHVDKNTLRLSSRDLYCFEASLYKHWTPAVASRRSFLSFGFMLPYSLLGRNENDPRVRLSQRIEKHIQYR